MKSVGYDCSSEVELVILIDAHVDELPRGEVAIESDAPKVLDEASDDGRDSVVDAAMDEIALIPCLSWKRRSD